VTGPVPHPGAAPRGGCCGGVVALGAAALVAMLLHLLHVM